MPLTKVASSMLASGASGSGGSTGKNYISSYNGNPCNGDFETGSISGWSVFSVSSITNGLPSGAPTTIAAGGSNPDITLVSPGSQLAGQYSLQASFPTTSQYKGFITEVFTIDAQDRAQVLTFGFHYQLTSSASNVNFSGTSSNTFIVSVYAVDGSNAGWIQPAGVYSMTQSSGAGFATGTFQTYSDTTQYRFAILCFNNPTTTSATVKFDDFSVGPTVVVNGTPVTDWQTYTPTIVGMTVSGTSYCQWRRVGDSIQIEARFSNSAVSASTLSVSLPFNYVIDTNKISVNGVVGHATAQVGVGSVLRFNVLGTGAGTTLTFGPNLSNGNGNALLAATDNLSFFAQVPITGFSSNVQISSDTDTRVVAAILGPSSSVSVTSGATNVIYTGIPVVLDTHGAFSSGTTYTVPVSGAYRISARAAFNATASAGQSQAIVRLFKNGTNFKTIGHRDVLAAEASGVTSYINGSTIVNLIAGETLTFSPFQDSGVTRSSCQLVDLSINRLSGPSVVAATETVACRYTNVAGTSIGTSSATIPFATKSYDTHNAFNGTTFTVPVSGKYLITAKIGAVVASSAISLEIQKAGVRVSFMRSPGTTNDTMVNISDQLDLVAGDLITFAGNIANASTLITNVGFNHISIVRVGN